MICWSGCFPQYRVPATADPRSDQRRRISQRAAAVRAVGGERRSCVSSAFAAEPFDTFSDRFLERRAQRRPRPHLRQPGAVRKRAPVRTRGQSRGSRPARRAVGGRSTAITRSWPIETPFDDVAAQSAFYVGGGYKYAMSGEGCAFLHAPPGFGDRPRDHRLVRRVRGPDAAARLGRLQQGRDALHGRDVRPVGPVPVQRGAADAVGERADHGAHLRACQQASGASARCAGRHRAWATPSSSIDRATPASSRSATRMRSDGRAS